MKPEDCHHYNKCNAPLCPLNPNSLLHSIWFPDEDICKNRKLSSKWIKTQKKIQKMHKKYNTAHNTYFTHQMLSSIKKVSRKIKGLNPDKPQNPSSWISKRIKNRLN